MDKKDILTKLFSEEKPLPTLPVLFDKINQMLADPHVSNKKIADVITKDQAMVIKILKLSNSAIYGTRQNISNLQTAITFLGVEKLKNLILQISLVKTFDKDVKGLPEFRLNIFWEHSLATAYFSNIIVEKLKIQKDENYYISGLLHDIGKLIIYQMYPDKFKDIIRIQTEQNLIDFEAEEKVLGVNHNDVGGFLARKWNFNPLIIDVIEQHHQVEKMEQIEVAVIQLANMFAKISGFCFPWDKKLLEIIGDPSWNVIAKSTESLDVDTLINDILSESGTVKEAVGDLLSTK